MKLDISNVYKLRNEIAFGYEEIKLKKEPNNNPWDRITATLDRIELTAEHLLAIPINSPEEIGSTSFFFVDYINHIYLLDYFIMNIAKEFIEETNITLLSDSSVFNEKESDREYLSFLRAITIAHPIDPDTRHESFTKKDILYCSFVAKNEGFADRKFDYVAIVNAVNNTIHNIGISSNQINQFISKRIEYVDEIVKAYKDFVIKRHKKHKRKYIKVASQFHTIDKYIENLSNELDTRIGNDYTEIFHFYSLIFREDLTHLKSELLDSYKIHILKLLDKMRAHLQKGIYDEELFDFTKLYFHYRDNKELSGFGYQISKLLHLNPYFKKYSSGLTEYCLKEMDKFFIEYVNLRDANNRFELCLLVNLALYSSALKQKLL